MEVLRINDNLNLVHKDKNGNVIIDSPNDEPTTKEGETNDLDQDQKIPKGEVK